MNAQQTTEDRIETIMRDRGFVVEVFPADSNPNMEGEWGPAANHWRAVIVTGEGSVTIPYSTGSQITTPDGADVLECLALDASSVANGESFEEWAPCLGYDTDSRAAERTYRAIKSQTRRVGNLIGSDVFAQVEEIVNS